MTSRPRASRKYPSSPPTCSSLRVALWNRAACAPALGQSARPSLCALAQAAPGCQSLRRPGRAASASLKRPRLVGCGSHHPQLASIQAACYTALGATRGCVGSLNSDLGTGDIGLGRARRRRTTDARAVRAGITLRARHRLEGLVVAYGLERENSVALALENSGEGTGEAAVARVCGKQWS